MATVNSVPSLQNRIKVLELQLNDWETKYQGLVAASKTKNDIMTVEHTEALRALHDEIDKVKKHLHDSTRMYEQKIKTVNEQHVKVVASRVSEGEHKLAEAVNYPPLA